MTTIYNWFCTTCLINYSTTDFYDAWANCFKCGRIPKVFPATWESMPTETSPIAEEADPVDRTAPSGR